MQNFEMILIENKIDKDEERKISKKEAKEKANQYGIKYYEICCINGLNIYKLLNQIIFDSYNKYYEKESRGEVKIENKLKRKKSAKVKKCCKYNFIKKIIIILYYFNIILFHSYYLFIF